MSGSKLVLVGDPHQLRAVGADGLFPVLAADANALDTVRRFTNPVGSRRVTPAPHGNPTCIDTYLAHDRIATSDDPIGDALQQWTTGRADGADVLVFAVDRATVNDFNHAARPRNRHRVLNHRPRRKAPAPDKSPSPPAQPHTPTSRRAGSPSHRSSIKAPLTAPGWAAAPPEPAINSREGPADHYPLTDSPKGAIVSETPALAASADLT